MERRIIIADNLFNKVHEILTVGQVIKNYGELCRILELPISAGNSKKAQLKNLNRYCLLDQDKQKFIVKEIYDYPKPKDDKRSEGKNHNLYITLFESILLKIFIEKNQTTLNFTKRELWEEMGMINKNYSYGYNNPEFLSKLQHNNNKVKQWHINKGFDNSKKELNDITRRALENLQRRKLICYRDDIIIARKDGKYFKVSLDWQIEKVLQCEYEALHELGCNNLKEVIFNHNKKVSMKSYYRLRDRKLKALLGFDFIYRQYSIICNREYLEKEYDENLSILKKNLNRKIIDALFRKSEKDFEKNRQDLKHNKTNFIYPNYYVEIQKYIITKILDIDEELIQCFEESLKIEAEMEALDMELFSA